MAFKIWREEFSCKEKFVTIIPGAYGICVCLKTRENNDVELIKYEKLEYNKVAKTLADYLTTEDLNLSKIYIGSKVFEIPKNRSFTDIKNKFKKFLESMER